MKFRLIILVCAVSLSLAKMALPQEPFGLSMPGVEFQLSLYNTIMRSSKSLQDMAGIDTDSQCLPEEDLLMQMSLDAHLSSQESPRQQAITRASRLLDARAPIFSDDDDTAQKTQSPHVGATVSIRPTNRSANTRSLHIALPFPLGEPGGPRRSKVHGGARGRPSGIVDKAKSNAGYFRTLMDLILKNEVNVKVHF